MNLLFNVTIYDISVIYVTAHTGLNPAGDLFLFQVFFAF